MNKLTEIEIQGLHEALDDEYHSWTTYDQVIADFGEISPFSHIRAAEERHIEALGSLFARYELPVPENPWPGKVARYATLQEACEAAMDAEIANSKMYDRLLMTTQHQDILAVLRNLQEASQQRHLPAFQRCAQRAVSGQDSGRHGAMHRKGKKGQI
ncbi:ferritin-like domain-containing protein [Nitrosomonas sp. ANs5]|uniref:ferritin-like domain-containing protein n=1 Tax=Nitrosomonas sp. ANs5 TaxID=3423941 RepID=UPI003D3267C5